MSELVGALTEGELTAERLETLTRAVAEELGVGAGKIIHPTRVAMSGRLKGPSLFHLMEILGKAEILSRFARAIDITRGSETRKS